jgi:hypothetical protein
MKNVLPLITAKEPKRAMSDSSVLYLDSGGYTQEKVPLNV